MLQSIFHHGPNLNLLLRGFGPASGGGGGSITTPTLAVTDNADGTGATATIDGSNSSSVNTVFVESLDDVLSNNDWANAGHRTGDGDVDLDLEPGAYFGYVRSTLSGDQVVSDVIYFIVTSGNSSIVYDCLIAAQARIQAIGFSGVSVAVRKLPVDRRLGPTSESINNVTLPAWILTPVTEQMPPQAGTNEMDDVTYGVLATFIAKDNQEPTLVANLDSYSLMRERVAKAFRNQRLGGVDSVINAFVQPQEFVSFVPWTNNLYVTALLLRFVSREPRGI